MDAAMAEEVNYASVVFKSGKQAPPQDEKENKKRRRYQKLACCLGILCVILLVGLVAVVVIQNNITNLTTRNQELETRNQELKNQKNNLTQQIQDMNRNEHNISRAQWSIDTYCPKDNSGVRTCTTCRRDWRQRGNSCYVYNNAIAADQITWEEARQRCRVNNADLAVAHNEQEKDGINGVNFGTAYWIGLRVEGGLWKWIDGSKLIDSWIVKPTEGHCAVFDLKQPWTSAPCGYKRQWICSQGALSL